MNMPDFQMLTRDIGASVVEFLLIQEQCAIKATSPRMRYFVDTSLMRNRKKAVLAAKEKQTRAAWVACNHKCVVQKRLLAFVSDACPRIESFFEKTFLCKNAQPLVFDMCRQGIVKKPEVDFSLLALMSCATNLRAMHLNMPVRVNQAGEWIGGGVNIMVQFPQLRKVYLTTPVSNLFTRADTRRDFVIVMNRIAILMKEVNELHFKMHTEVWTQKFSEVLQVWFNLRSLFVRSQICNRCPDEFDALVWLPYFLPRNVREVTVHVTLAVGEQPLTKDEHAHWEALFVKLLANFVRKSPLWEGSITHRAHQSGATRKFYDFILEVKA